MDQNSPPDDEEKFREHAARIVIRVGCGGLLASAFFLALSAYFDTSYSESLSHWVFALSLMLARTCGIASFLCGAALVLLERWTAGTLLFILSTALPALSFSLFGTI